MHPYFRDGSIHIFLNRYVTKYAARRGAVQWKTYSELFHGLGWHFARICVTFLVFEYIVFGSHCKEFWLKAREALAARIAMSSCSKRKKRAKAVAGASCGHPPGLEKVAAS